MTQRERMRTGVRAHWIWKENMEFTFGIITGGQQDDQIHAIIDSIEREHIPEYEIIVVGAFDPRYRSRIRVIAFDETIKKAWITRKKNLITQHARYENIVYLHDYVAIEEGWYPGFLEFGDDFAVAMTPISNPDGSPFQDWLFNPLTCEGKHLFVVHNKIAFIETGIRLHDPTWQHRECMLPHHLEADGLNHLMYFSGTYWVAKKWVMEKFPLDEALCWDEFEDVVWSQFIREEFRFRLNSHSRVRLLKQKSPFFTATKPETLSIAATEFRGPHAREDLRIAMAFIYKTVATACVFQQDFKRSIAYLNRALRFDSSVEFRTLLSLQLKSAMAWTGADPSGFQNGEEIKARASPG